MNYHKIYRALVERGKCRILKEYSESHHIVPRCMGGSDDKENLVDLTPEEHYLAHQLLMKMYPDSHSLAKAAAMMIPNRPSNKMYGWVRRKFAKAQSECQSGSGNSQFGTIWITDGNSEKKWKSSDRLPDGWTNMRLSKFKTIEKAEKRRIQKEKDKQAFVEEKRKALRILHSIYIKDGFDAVVETGYSYSKPNLVASFSKYLPEFKPQNGKKRKL